MPDVDTRLRGSVLPGVTQLREYRRPWLLGEVLAGVTVAAYLIPQVMAYAGLAGLPPVAGLRAILPSLVIYAILGSSRQLSVGPESTTALMAATVVDVAGFRRLASFRRTELTIAIAALVGVLTFDILYGILVAIGLSAAELLYRVARRTTPSSAACRTWPECTTSTTTRTHS